MKYFENLPKKTFSSSVGDFVISDFFTYLDSGDLNLTTSNVEIDSKTTLLEASYTVYNDPNAFWLFLTSNKTINPFNLLATNVNIFITDNENKIGLNLVSSPTGSTAFGYPQGSIIVPFIANTGDSAAYSSLGNFDLNGPLTLIEDVSFYSADMVIKAQQGGTFISSDGTTGSGVLVITPIKGGTYSIQKILYPSNTKKAIDTVVKVELSAEGIIEDIGVSDKYTPPKKGSSSAPKSTPSGISGGTEISALSINQLSSKNIDAIIQSQVGLLKSYFVSAKYN
jgi:hypothetical protein